MGKIQRLSDELANQIAAGEVVERPASVVKELVENSIDAEATKIRLSFTASGTELISITDDGIGMDDVDAKLCLERHATSKLRVFDDLESIRTLGFRGEALPSIASVSKFEILTRRRGDPTGTRVTLHPTSGEIESSPAGGAEGTTVRVEDLFFNVPARRKFLKSMTTEAAQIVDVIEQVALARPTIAFSVEKDGRMLREYLRADDRAGRVAQVFQGKDLVHCKGMRGPIRIEGFLSRPQDAKGVGTDLRILINGRAVRDRALARAVMLAYGSLLESGRYPYGTLYLDLPPELVDVNVHPQKTEVRFLDSRAVFDAISKELREGLARVFAIPMVPSRPDYLTKRVDPAGFGQSAPQESSVSPRPPVNYVPLRSGGPSLGGRNIVADSARPPAIPASSPSSFGHARPAPDLGREEKARPQVSESLFSDHAFYASLRFLSQVRQMYLLCEGADGLYILDQHAAAERINYDKLRKQYASRTIATQALLIPEKVPVSQPFSEDLLHRFSALGIVLRRSGDELFLHEVPAILGASSGRAIVAGLSLELETAATEHERNLVAQTIDRIFATMACHGSIRAGDLLGPQEARALLDQLDGVDFAGHCPHGRPIITRVAFSELERRVGR